MMYPSISREDMIEVDRVMTDDLNIPVPLMMEHAGLNLAKIAVNYAKSLNYADELPFLVVVGSGNNAGGGLVAARRLHNWGFDCKIWLAKGKPKREVPRSQYQRAISCGVKIIEDPHTFDKTRTILIDSYLGYNFRAPLRKDAAHVLEVMTGFTHIIALDIPSGIDSNTGLNAAGLQAKATVTLAWPKHGMLRVSRNDLGAIYLVDIGVPSWVYKKILDQSSESTIESIQILHKLFSKSSVVELQLEQKSWKLLFD